MAHYCGLCGRRMTIGKEHHCKQVDINNEHWKVRA
jgi:hypothetical protein